jgi:hypothetical protein
MNNERSDQAGSAVSMMSVVTGDMPEPGAEGYLAGRRGFLRGLGGAALGLGGLLQPSDVFSMAEDAQDKALNQTVSEHARSELLPAFGWELPRWRPERSGNFDLRNSRDNHFAFAKVQANLAGEYSWLAQYGWILICPPGEPAFPFLGRLTLAKIFVTAADEEWAPDAGEDDYTMWAVFTTTHVDPRTFEPVSRKLNPYTGKMIDVPTIHYADRLSYRFGQSIVVPGVDPAFYTQPWDAEGGFSQHFIDAGGEVSYTVLGSSQHSGPHQPRCDVGFWTVSRDELMNPSLRAIDTRRDYSVIQKITEYAWYGAPAGDPAQLMVHLTGLKTQDPSRLPSFIKSFVLERFPERFA